jgi:signal transduction histidine kinase
VLLPVSERKRMEEELRKAEERIALSALDGLLTHIAILDAEGTILAINKAWRDFARDKQAGTDRGRVGANYFVHCEAPEISPGLTKFAEGVQAVLRGQRAEFSLEYPCQVRGEEKWFHGKVTRFADHSPVRAVVAHEDISQRVRLEREIVAVSAREQQRFGQELHDGLSQQLTGLKFKASLLEYQLQSKGLPEAKDAKAISELLNGATDEASKLARSVQPVEVDSRGLMMALKELAAKIEHAHDVTCTCEFRRPVFIHDNNVATNVYRIAEEAVRNALKHSGAKHLWIELNETKDGVTLTVRDNGKGLPAKLSEEHGLGVHMMRYRARMIGGSVELRRNLNGGTTVISSFQKRPVPTLARPNRRENAA